MSRPYVCDQCDYTQSEPLVYRLTQMVEPEEDDGEDDEFDTVTYHFCSTSCLDLFVMAIPREIEERRIHTRRHHMTDFQVTLFALERFITARWKALVPFVLYGVSEALSHGPVELNTPTGIKAFLTAVVIAIAVHATPNRPTK